MANVLKHSLQVVHFPPGESADACTPSHFPGIESQYQALLTAMLEGALLHGEHGQILIMNPVAERVLGLSAAEAVAYGASLSWSIVSENGSALAQEHQPWMVTLRTGQPQSNVVMGIRRADGRLVWIAANSQPLFASGSASCHAVMTVFQDITQQRLEQDTLWQDETPLHALFEAIPNPFFVKDRDGRYLACNSAFENYLGVDRQRILGKSVYEIAPKELAERDAAADQALFDNPGIQIDEAKVKWADGSLRDVIFHTTTLTRADGSVRGLTGLIVDISDHKQMETALRLQEQQYRTLVEHSPDLIVRYDTQLRRIYVNQAWEKASGLRADEVINKPAAEIPRAAQPVISEYLTALKRALREGERQAVEFSWINARDETLYLQNVVVPEIDQEGKVVSLLSVGRDITEYKRSEDALRTHETHLRQVNRALQTLSAGNETLIRAVSEQELLEKMCQTMVEKGGHVLAIIGAVTQDGMAIEPRAWSGPSDAVMCQAICTKNCPPLLLALERGEPIVVHDIASYPHCSGCEAHLNSYDIRSSLILPLQSEGVNLGVLLIHSANQAAFDDDEVVLMSKLGNDLSYGIRALRNRLDREAGARRLQVTMEETIQALANTVEFRDPYTAGHQRRVAQLATEIAREIGLTDNRITGLYLAAVIHDIGKIKVPVQVLIRPGRLSELEFEMVKTHVEVGYNILKSIDFPWPIAKIVRQHHERMDGSGYPLGIDATELLLESRILAVADVVEAISSFRPYRPGLGIDHALEQIEAGRGKLYDSDVVDACIHVFRELNFSFDKQAEESE
ncbi:MAG: PAS domain S-box protein [Chromatiales bacterium]|jgi:PAS domain S-box-containing protein/putative nucleotidyltransferase with HDIG domain